MSGNELHERLARIVARAKDLELAGVPFPLASVRNAIETAVVARDRVRALYAIDRAERLLRATVARWKAVEELISRAEVLRTTAEELGVSVVHVEATIGNPRALVQAGPLSTSLFEQARRMATTTIELLRRAIPERAVLEARKLGTTIQAAERRGEDVREAARAFRALLQAIKAEPSPMLVQRLAATRRAVGKIPSAPAMAFPDVDDAEEILLEARILARRINRIKRNARDAQSAARLMTHVRAALSEDRRSGTAAEEIEELWTEVTRLTQEQGRAAARAPVVPPNPRPATSRPTSPFSLPVVPEGADPSTAEGRSRRARLR